MSYFFVLQTYDLGALSQTSCVKRKQYLAIDAAIMHSFASRAHEIGFFSAIFAKNVHR